MPGACAPSMTVRSPSPVSILAGRLPRGLALTDEGQSLLPLLSDAFGRIGTSVEDMGGRVDATLFSRLGEDT